MTTQISRNTCRGGFNSCLQMCKALPPRPRAPGQSRAQLELHHRDSCHAVREAKLFGRTPKFRKPRLRRNAQGEKVLKRMCFRENDLLDSEPSLQRFFSGLLAVVTPSVEMFFLTIDKETRCCQIGTCLRQPLASEFDDSRLILRAIPSLNTVLWRKRTRCLKLLLPLCHGQDHNVLRRDNIAHQAARCHLSFITGLPQIRYHV